MATRDPPESKKRKREADPPRVLFSTPSRTFERLLKESSLEALRSTVAKKLGLGEGSALEFSQIRDGKSIDLEDEDDFDAFTSFATCNGVAEVSISIPSVTLALEQRPQTLKRNGPANRKAAPTNKTNRNNDALQSRAPMTLANALMSTFGSASNENGNVGQSSDVVNTVAQDNETLEPQCVSPNAADEAPRTDSTEISGPSTKKLLDSSKKKSRSSKAKLVLPVAGADLQESADHTGIEMRSAEKAAANQSVEQEHTTVLNVTKEGKKRKVKERKSKKDVQAAVAPTSELTSALPSVPSVPLRTVSEPDPVSTTPAISSERKKRESKNMKLSIPLDRPSVTTPAHPQSASEPSTSTLPIEEVAHSNRSGGVQANISTSEAASSREKKHKSRKRKPEANGEMGPEVPSASETGKSKKRKTIDNDAASSAAATHTVQSLSESPPTLDSAPVAPKPKPAKTRAKKKTPPDQTSPLPDYDEALDSAIANVLQKRRVSVLSRQIASTAPVTIAAASSASNSELVTGRPIVADANDASMSKPNQKSKSKAKKAKSVEASRATSSIDISNTGPSSTIPEINATINATIDGGAVQHSEQQRDAHRAPSQTINNTLADTADTNSEQTATANSAKERGQDIAAVESNHSASYRQIRPGSRVNAKQTGESDKTPISRSKDQHGAKESRPFLPSVASHSEILMQGKDESTSSDSDSDSDTSDSGSDSNDSESSGATSKPQKATFTSAISARSVIPPEPDSSFPISSFDLNGGSINLDALLNPDTNLSWRDIPLPPEKVSDDDEKLMSDVEDEEEDEEKENNRKAPRVSLSFRRASLSPSTDEDDEDDDNRLEDADTVIFALANGTHADTDATIPHEGSVVPNHSEVTCPDGAKPTPPSTEQADGDKDVPLFSKASLSIKTAGTDAPHVASQMLSPQLEPLPSFKDVNARGESVFTEGAEGIAVSQAMDEDDTSFLMGLSKTGREIELVAQPADDNTSPEEKQVLTFDTQGPSPNAEATNQSNELMDSPNSISDTSKESEERNPSPLRSTYSLRSKAASTTHTDQSTRPSSQKSKPSQGAEVILRVPCTEPVGKVKRMKGRQGKKIEASQTLPLLVPDQALSPTIPTNSSENVPDFAESTPVGAGRPLPATRRAQVTSQVPSNQQSADAPISKAVIRREDKVRMELKPGGAADGLRKPELRLLSSLPVPEVRTESLQPAKQNTPATERSSNVIASKRSALNGLVTQEKANSRLFTSQKAHTLDAKSGPTTEVERSVNGSANIADSNPLVPPSDQPTRRKVRAGQRAVSYSSSVTEDSGSDDNEATSTEQRLIHAPRPSLVGIRSLQDIANRRDLFSPVTTPQPSSALSPVKAFGSHKVAGQTEVHVSDSDDSSSSSDSDGEVQSNIPKDKRAGSAVSTSKSSQGFKSFFPFL